MGERSKNARVENVAVELWKMWYQSPGVEKESKRRQQHSERVS